MLDAKTISENLNQDLDELVVEITQRVLGQNIPFVSDDIAQQAGSLFDVMDDLKQAIDILLEKETQLDMGQLADLLNSITLDDDFVPITAKETDSGDLIVFFTLQDLASLSDLDLNAGGSIGISDDAFKLDGGVAVDLQLDYQFAIQIEQGTGDTDFAEDEVDTEVTLTINGEVDFNVAADNALGFLDVALTDNEISDPNAPKNDLMLVLGLDLKDGADSTVSMSGSATLDFNVMAGAPDIRILPEFGANVFVQVNYADADLLSDGSAAEGDFTIELRDVVFKLQALSGMLQDVFSTVSDILNTFPLGEIIDLLVARLPVVDDLAPSEFDFDEDGKITLQDVITLISVLNPDGLPPVFGFIQGVVLLAEVIDAVDELATGLAEDGCFDIGTLRLTSDALDTISNGATFPESARLISSEDSDLQNLADLVEAFGAFNDFIGLDEEVEEDAAAAPAASDTDPGAALFVSALSAASAPQSAQSSAADEGGPFDVPDVGLSFPFLASPEALASSLGSLLLNGAGAPAVSLIEFDLPPLEFRVYDEIGIRFGPFFGALYGEFYAGVDINIGYDTAGFGDSFDFAKGLYVSPDLPQVEVNGALKTPVGTVQLGVGVIGGLDVVIARVAVKGGLLGQIDVFLGGTSETDNKARLSELGGCFFNEIAGRLTAGIDLVFRFGFGAFSIERTKSIATVTLAQFDIEPCSPKPNEILDELELSDAGLAGDQGDGTLLLHVGTDSDKRSLPDAADAEFDENGDRIGDGRAETETFFVGLVPEDGDNPAADGEVAVFAFGIFQRFGNGDVALQRIVGSGGSENDTLTVSASVNLDAELSGDAGNDVLVGGGGNDILSGDEGNDQLDGDLGNDTLEGGIGNDVLRGGAGADSIDGGDDFDQVDFSQSSEGIFLIESASTAGLMLGQGGEAEGDRVRNVEHFIGSNFDDTFYGNTTVGNVFEGGLGNDVLIGGNEGDLFIGGLGADIMRGNRSGEPDTPGDGASYVFSDGGVIIDLPLGVGWGGEAQGDRFYGIENFQLSRNADRFLGDDVANLVDGYDGDDILEGGGGRDTIGAGVGNDTVFAVGDGDNLDGGGFLNYRPDMDLLSYEKASAGVNVDLHDGDGRIRGVSGPGDDIAFSQYIQFNAEAENEILSRSRSDDVRISSFENLTGSVFDDVLRGDDRGNTIRGGAGDDTISGQAGDDLLVGGLGADEIFGDDGTDTADYRLSNALVFADLRDGAVGVGGHATGDTYTGVENLIGSQFADSLVGNDLNNRLDPHLNTTGSVESLVGFGGTDTAVLNYRTDSSGDGIAMFLASTGAGAVRRTEPGQTSGDLAVNLNTIEQVDAVTSAGEDQFISRIRGNDNVNTAQGDDFIDMFEGSDRIRAGAGDDVVLRFGELSSVEFLYTGAGDAMRDAYILDGGRGIDTLGVDISYTARDIVWLAEEPGATESDRVIRLEGGGVIRNFEILYAMISGSGNDFVGQLGEVSNIFSTRGGADVVTVGLGADIADGGSSATQNLFGVFEDVDTLIVDYSGQAGQVIHVPELSGLSAQYDGLIRLVSSSSSSTPLAQVQHRNFERILLTGTDSNDHLVGSDRVYANLFGPTPGDILIGGLGRDYLQGLAGDDTLRGGEGRDTLEGGDGDDVLIGGERNGLLDDADVLTGGLGADRFVIGDSSGNIYNGQEDGATITDFSTAQGDVIQLAGGPGNYRIEVQDPFIFGSGAIYLVDIYTTSEATGQEVLLLRISSDAPLSLTDSAFTYVGAASPNFVALNDVPLEISEDILGSSELTARLWQSGAVSDEDLLTSLQQDPVVFTSQLLAEAADSDPGPSITAEDATEDALILINEVISDFAVPLLELDRFTFYNQVVITGSDSASGTFTDMFGFGEGIVLSTGNVEDIIGQNTDDGRFAFGPRPGNEFALEFETLGALEGGTLYRALVPDLPGGVSSLVLQDDADQLGGLPGFFSAFDLDALFFSSDDITSTAGLSRAQLNATSRLGVIDYDAAGIEFEAGEKRPGGFQDNGLWGTVNGMVNFDVATLDTADWDGESSLNSQGAMSFGEGGKLSLSLNGSVSSTQDSPAYLYLYEIGVTENMDGAATVSAQDIGTEGDLSTDLGVAGIEGDTTTLTSIFAVDFDGILADAPDFDPLTSVDFFDVVIVTEELPERGGADLPDLVSVKVNGVDVLLDANGATVTMNSLASSPYAGYAPELTLNLVGEGPLEDQIKADAYTTAFRIAGPIVDGLNTIEVSVSDQADAFLDTAVFIAPIEGGLPVNRAPVARNDVLRLNENATASINILTGDGLDTDADGDTLTIAEAFLLDANGNDIQDIKVDETTQLMGQGGSVTLQKSGALTFDTDGDFNSLSDDEFASLRIRYSVEDGTDTDDAMVSIIVDGESPRNSDPVFTSAARFETPENTIIGFDIAATDSDGPSPITYALQPGGDAFLFSIDPASGLLRFNAAPDFESPSDNGGNNVYDIVVTASDGQNVVTDTVSVLVRDVAELCDGLNPVRGSGKDDRVNATREADCIETQAGTDVIVADLESINQDLILDFSDTDTLLIAGARLTSDTVSIQVLSDRAIFDVIGEKEQVSQFEMMGDYADTAFELLSNGIDTEISIAGPGATALSISGERFVTSDNGENRVFGSGSLDAILTSGGNDIAAGGDGNDVMDAGAGDDLLLGGPGGDRLTGGEGADIFAFDVSDYSGVPTADFITDFTPGKDILELSGFEINSLDEVNVQESGDNLLLDLKDRRFIVLEDLAAGDLRNSDVKFSASGRSYDIVSTAAVRRLTDEDDRFVTSEQGEVSIYAGDGDDAVISGDAKSAIYGEGGDDVLFGSAFDDILQGGDGSDRMLGGDGADQFVFDASENKANPIIDFIVDFDPKFDTVVAAGFGLDVENLSFINAASGDIVLLLAQNHFVVFEQIQDAEKLGDFEQVFDFG